jgi:hypothetical protein
MCPDMSWMLGAERQVSGAAKSGSAAVAVRRRLEWFVRLLCRPTPSLISHNLTSLCEAGNHWLPEKAPRLRVGSAVTN